MPNGNRNTDTAGPKIDKLIVNSPYEEPQKHWEYNRGQRQFEQKDGRRLAGYTIANPQTEQRGFDDAGVFCPIELANAIRPLVASWRAGRYPGASTITRSLLEHWHDRELRTFPFFFCQLEAIETLIWLTEAPAMERNKIEVPGDSGPFARWCCKMATGSGKTVVMAMLIAWQILNKVHRPKDKRFVKNILIVAPGLTVKNRLEVLKPSDEKNYYEEFKVVPGDLLNSLAAGRILIHNWHSLAWETQETLDKKKSVVKLGEKSPMAYAKEILGDIAVAKEEILVINDEAHHAWRTEQAGDRRLSKLDKEEATIWMKGLDRLHRVCPIKYCVDLSATPYISSGGRAEGDTLFSWIVSDFGLNDAIESGLVKTPRVVIRDDARRKDAEYRSRIYHIYNDSEVKEDLRRNKDQVAQDAPLPALVTDAYHLLGLDWQKTWKKWQTWKKKHKSKDSMIPVMISVANNVTTAARIKHAFSQERIPIKELCQEDGLLHIDSSVLKKAEARDHSDLVGQAGSTSLETKQEDREEALRKKVSTVGKPGEPGQSVRNIIAVGMLSEGWDAQTVTHIMGLRAFGSQLLCEQVVGRGLRRTSYEMGEDGEGLFEPEYVNVFGVPFTFLPHEWHEGSDPAPPGPKTHIYADEEKQEYKISWPNILRVNEEYREDWCFDPAKLPSLTLKSDGCCDTCGTDADYRR